MSAPGEAGRLVGMVNQIGTFFHSQRGRDEGEAVADHLRKFWTPGMRATLQAHAAAGGEGLSEAAQAGVRALAAFPVKHGPN